MKLLDDYQDQKLALDMTPLIDIVFLLVLFFAVSTSFISADDLVSLKDSVISLGRDKQSLTMTVGQKSDQVRELRTTVDQKSSQVRVLRSQLGSASESARKLESMVGLLERQKVTLSDYLDGVEARAGNLEQQLEQAFQDFEELNVELGSQRILLDRGEENQRLLRALLLERADQNTNLQGSLDMAEEQRQGLGGAQRRVARCQ